MIVAFEHLNHKKSLTGRLISWAESFEYVHVELIFNHQGWVCFSARNRNKGVAFLPFDEVVKDASKWKFFSVEPPHHNDQNDEAAHGQALLLEGNSFNYNATVWHLFFGYDIKASRGKFCSQLCYEILTQNTQLPLLAQPSIDITPKDLYEMMNLRYPEIKLETKV